MKAAEIKCPNCGYKIGMLSIRRIRLMVHKLIKHIDEMPQWDKQKLEMELEQVEQEAEAQEIALAKKIEKERQEWLNEQRTSP